MSDVDRQRELAEWEQRCTDLENRLTDAWDRIQLAEKQAEQLRLLANTVQGHACSTHWREPCGHERRILAALGQVERAKERP